jgi:hypothetical protein
MKKQVKFKVPALLGFTLCVDLKSRGLKYEEVGVDELDIILIIEYEDNKSSEIDEIGVMYERIYNAHNALLLKELLRKPILKIAPTKPKNSSTDYCFEDYMKKRREKREREKMEVSNYKTV